MRQVADSVLDFFSNGLQIGELGALLCHPLGQFLAPVFQTDGQQRHALTDIVVQLERNSSALIVLRIDQLGSQVANAIVVLTQCFLVLPKARFHGAAFLVLAQGCQRQ